ncbi:TorF family putative porin [Sphingosinicella sp.]|uniref:TorF family putative porin n=1 Tax=Sphingosinicella sp. TaxID=1917971 RepID=UPI004037C1AE
MRLWLLGMAGLLLPATALAQEMRPPRALSFEGAATLVSDYRFRGISLSDGHAAVQGTATARHRSGAYLSFWASTLDGFGELGGSNLELDLYAGVRHPLAGGTLDVGLLYYAYPGSSGGDFEFFEPYASYSHSFGPANAKFSLAFAPAQDALGGNSNFYAAADLAVALPATPMTLRAHAGRSHGNTPLSPTGDYLEWQFGADLVWRGLTLGVTYVDTDLSAAEAISAGAAREIVAPTIVLSLTANF